MSDLREHLQAAKREYRAHRYPGDLARDAMKLHRASRSIQLFVRTMTAIAAVIAIAVVGWMALHGSRSTLTKIASQNVEPTTIATSDPATSSDESGVLLLASVSAPTWSEVYSTDKSDSSEKTVAASPSWPTMPSFPSMDQIDATSVDETLNNQENE